MFDPSPPRGYLGNGVNSQKRCVFVFRDSSETGRGEVRKKWGKMSLRGLLAFVPQVKWPNMKKKKNPYRKADSGPEGHTSIRASGKNEPGFAFTPPMQRKNETKMKSNASFI